MNVLPRDPFLLDWCLRHELQDILDVFNMNILAAEIVKLINNFREVSNLSVMYTHQVFYFALWLRISGAGAEMLMKSFQPVWKRKGYLIVYKNV